MSRITEKRSFSIPPCSVDKDLVKKLGQLLEKEYESYYMEIFEETKKKLQEGNIYKKYPEKLTEDVVKADMYPPSLTFSLYANSRNIESASVTGFVEAEWPDDASEISMKLGSPLYAHNGRTINVSIYLARCRMKDSEVEVSGSDSTWVNGIAVKLEKVFEGKRLSYHLLVTHSSIRWALSLI
ncbi:MAG TPA: hypothetical protein VMT42_04015, partial [candidate division Zixibacteria bacterium]|nr:hypothetical protein [candidate division Zixibacteria bacterium]